MSLKNVILRVTRRTKKGFTVGEIFDRVSRLYSHRNVPYSSVRARVYEMAKEGLLVTKAKRADSLTGRKASAFVRS